VKVVLKRDNAH